MTQQPQPHLNVGVIGVGGIAKSHMPGWEASPHTQVTAGADLSAAALDVWGEKHRVKQLHQDPQKLIDDPEIHVIDVCTPSAYHADLSIKALKSGKHVICEKPLAISTDEIRRMIAARDESGKLLMTAQHERYQPHSQAMKAEVETGRFGEIYHARSWYLRRFGIPARPGFIYKKHAGGGPCIDIGVHCLDLTLWLMDFPKPVSVSGVARRKLADQPGAFSGWGGTPVPPDIDVEDFAAAFVRFDNGASLILETSWMLHHKPENDFRIWLYGTKAGATVPDGNIHRTDNDIKQVYDEQLTFQPRAMEAHAAECFAFARAIADGLPSPVPPEQSLIVQTILNGLYESQETGREVSLDATV
jgi:predicted dehydrogenase